MAKRANPRYAGMTTGDFIKQYAESIDRMMASKAKRLDLPPDFLTVWGEMERQERAFVRRVLEA